MTKVNVVVLMGQSNLQGTKSTYALDDAPNSYPITLGSDFETAPSDAYYWDKVNRTTTVTHSDDGQWAPLVLGTGFNNPPGVPGPADAGTADCFGGEMQLHYRLSNQPRLKSNGDEDFYYIKCCLGGTELGSAIGPDWNPETAGEMFELFKLYYWKPAIEALFALGLEPQLVGVFWAQGAADSLLQALSDEYETNLENFYHAINGVMGVPNAPWIIQRETILDGSHVGLADVKVAQERVCSRVPNMEFFDSDQRTENGRTLFLQYDGEHFTGDGQVDMGEFAARGLIRAMRRGVSPRPIPKVGY